jgi:hypothetical protein
MDPHNPAASKTNVDYLVTTATKATTPLAKQQRNNRHIKAIPVFF